MKLHLILFISLLTFFSCSKETDTASEKQDKLKDIVINLKYNLKPGDSHSFKLTTFTSQNQTITGDTLMNTKSTQTESYFINAEILNKLDKNNIVQLTIPKIEMSSTMNDEKISYNSEQKYSKEERSRYNDYESLLNTPFKIVFGDDGDIVDITGADKIIDKMARTNGMGAQITPEQKAALTQQLAAVALKPLSQQLFRKLPNTNVAIDSTWYISYESQMASFKVQNNAIFTLKDIQIINSDTLLTIDAGLTARVDGENKLEQNNTLYVFHDPVISGSGQIKYNHTKGTIQTAETTVKIEMVIEVYAKNEFNKDVKFLRSDNTVNSYKVELLK